MIYTYAFLDLPALPQSIVDAAWASLKTHKGQIDTQVNNWENQPGYKDYEYRTFNLPDGQAVKTVKSHRYPINSEFDQWVQDHFDQDPTPCGISYYDNHSSLFAPHVDISRDYTIMYFLDLGGTNVDTVWYRQKGHSLLRPDIKAVFDLSKLVNNYNNLEEIDRVCFPLNRWVCINSAIIHEVQNIQSTRIAIQISRNTALSHVNFTTVSWHRD
jgi:hypothetical protein